MIIAFNLDLYHLIASEEILRHFGSLMMRNFLYPLQADETLNSHLEDFFLQKLVFFSLSLAKELYSNRACRSLLDTILGSTR